MPCWSRGIGWERSTIQDNPSSDSQAQTVPRNHHDTDSSVLHGLIVDAGTTSTVMRQSHLRSRWTQISHSTSSSTWRRSREPDIPMLKSTLVETLRALFRKLGYSERVAEFLTSTLRPSSVNLYETHWQSFVSYCQHFQSSQSAVLPLSGVTV